MWNLFSKILVRTPVLSLKKINEVGNEVPSIFQEGVYLSSAAYWNELQKRDTLTEAEQKKLDRTYAKYWLRSCTRPTPYATFAGCLTTAVSEEDTAITLSEPDAHIRNTRLDMNYLTDLVRALCNVPAIAAQITYKINNSLYELPDGYRYAEYTISNNNRYYHLTYLQKTPYLSAIISACTGHITRAELYAILMQFEDVTEEDAIGYVEELCRSQVLISSLEPSITGETPLEQIIQQLSTLKNVAPILDNLTNIQRVIGSAGNGVDSYKSIEQELRKMGASVEIPNETLQTDLYLSAKECKINRALLQAIQKQTEDLFLLSRLHKNDHLGDFRERFYERYEDAEIPLQIVLDADLGIGYGNANEDTVGGNRITDDLFVNTAVAKQPAAPDHLQQYALFKYQEFLTNGNDHIEIKQEELYRFKRRVVNHSFPQSMYLIGQLMKKDGKLDADHFLFDLSTFSGPSAGNLLGRFAHGSAAIHEFTKEILEKEEQQQPDAIFAEVVHMPQARLGNILLRPVLRQYEIPYVGKSGAAADMQINVDDLLVSVQHGEVILRSKRLGVRIIPRLTTAHNYTGDNLPIYKFLCELQSQNFAYPNTWDWGAADMFKHLPRVVYKNIIVKKARWKIDEKDVADIPAGNAARIDHFRTWRETIQLPSKVVYVEGDNELLIDLEIADSIEILLHYLKRRKSIQVEEFISTEENCIVKDVHGDPYVNELIIPLYFQPAKPIQRPVIKKYEVGAAQRKFQPYSEWQYYKIYSGPKTMEKLLKDHILHFVEDGLQKGLFEKFFFVRYRDEFSHLRIRFYNSDPDKQLVLQKEFSRFLSTFLAQGVIDKVTIDTYTRELERYGPGNIGHTETLFCNDSLAVLRFISLLDSEEGEQYRFIFALRGIDCLLDDFGYSAAGKAALLKQMQESYFREFGAHPVLQKQLNAKYREMQKSIISFMNAADDNANEIADAVSIFTQRSEMNLPIVRQIIDNIQQGNTGYSLTDIVPSYIHMYMNRLFIAQARKYELTAYHFLERYYTSQLAISKQKSKMAIQ